MAFECLEIAHEIIKQLRVAVKKIAARDPDLAKQLRKAASSIPLNIAEGCERTGRDKHYHYAVALSSSREVLSNLRVAIDRGYIEPEDVADARGSIDRTSAMLWKMSPGR